MSLYPMSWVPTGLGKTLLNFSTAYVTTMTASQLLAVWFINRFGRRISFTLIMTVFMCAGVLCAFSPSIEILIAGRVVKGFAQALFSLSC